MTTPASEPSSAAILSESNPYLSPRIEAMRRRMVRMSYDVHDGPLQELIAMSYGLEQLRASAAEGCESVALADGIALLKGRLGETEAMLRAIMLSLEETAALPADTAAIVEEQVTAFRLRCPEVVTRLLAVGDLHLETDSQRIVLSRLLRESLANVGKHAEASTVCIDLRGLPGALLVQISDDGKGFDPTNTDGRVGLRALRDRLEMLGGAMTLDSNPNGTTITATIDKWQPPATRSSEI
jgi:two-component system NarL family sensor kinase